MSAKYAGVKRSRSRDSDDSEAKKLDDDRASDEHIRAYRKSLDDEAAKDALEAHLRAEEAARGAARAQLLGITTAEDDVLYAKCEFLTILSQEARQLRSVYEEKEREIIRMAKGTTDDEEMRSKEQERKQVCLGDLRYREFLGIIANMKMMRFAPQMEVVRAAAGSLIVQMFGADFETHKSRIMAEYGITDFRLELLVTMPRRHGKTEIVSVIEAAAQKVMGGHTAIFAYVLAQASDLMQLIYNRLLEIENGDKSRFVVKNSRRIEYSKTSSKTDPNRGVIRCFSGNKDSARGFKATRIIFDEASFAKADFINKNIFAGMLMRSVVVIMISSPPSNAQHIFTKMCTAKFDDGTSVFKYLGIDNMCAECRKRRDHVIKCPHRQDMSASWLAGETSMKMIEQVLAKVDPTTFRQEILGLMEDQDLSVFQTHAIAGLRDEKEVSFEKPPSYIIVGVDPSNGGDSETAIVAMTMDSNRNCVVSADCFCLCGCLRRRPCSSLSAQAN